MARLEVTSSDGIHRTVELIRTQPVSIGRHESNDIRTDDAAMPVLHSRIAWNKEGFEVTAAGPGGVTVNGETIRNRMLVEGDVLSIGRLTIAFHESPPAAGKRKTPDKSEDMPRRPAAQSPGPVESVDSVEILSAEELAIPEPPMLIRSGSDRKESPRREALRERETGDRSSSSSRRWTEAKRPGEQDLLRSPLVIGLAGTAAVLLLIAGTVWMMIGRQSVQQQFQQAVAELEQGRYRQAMDAFSTFLARYPRHELSPDARFGLAQAMIEREIGGGVPNWGAGLEQVQEYISREQARPEFAARSTDLYDYGRKIAFGAVRSAAQTRQQELLDIAIRAEQLSRRFAPPDGVPAQQAEQWTELVNTAVADIAREQQLQSTMSEIAGLLSEGRAIDALQKRAELLKVHPVLRDDGAVRKAFADALAVELKNTVAGAVEQLPEHEVTPSIGKSLVLAEHTQSRQLSDGDQQASFNVEGIVLGIDVQSGRPRWSRGGGNDGGFPPFPLSAGVPSVLVYDSARQLLLRLASASGDVLWRLPIGSAPAGAPLVTGGQIYLATDAARLLKIDAETGEPGAEVRFSQPLSAGPALLRDEASLIVPGERSLAYVLSLRPLECTKILYLEHRRGAIQTAPSLLGKLILFCENDRAASCALRVIDPTGGTDFSTMSVAARIGGNVTDPSVVRGRQLFVPARGVGVVAFTASDDPGQPRLTEIARSPVIDFNNTAVHLQSGGADEVWLHAREFQRLELVSGDVLRLDPKIRTDGFAARRPVPVDDGFLIAERNRRSTALAITRFLTADSSSPWRLVYGSRVLELLPTESGTPQALNDLGQVFRLSETVSSPREFLTASQTLALPKSANLPLQVRSEATGHRLLWSSADDGPGRLWIFEPAVRDPAVIDIKQSLEALPCRLDARIVLPTVDGVEVIQRDGRSAGTGYQKPVGDPTRQQFRWRQAETLDDDECLLLDDADRLHLMQFVTEPETHLEEIASWAASEPVTGMFKVLDDRLAVPLKSGALVLLEPRSFDETARLELPGEPTGKTWTVDHLLFVATADDQLTMIEISDEAKVISTIDLAGTGPAGFGLAGSPTAFDESSLLLARVDGRLLRVSRETGEITGEVEVEGRFSTAPVIADESIYIGGQGGQVFVVAKGDLQP